MYGTSRGVGRSRRRTYVRPSSRVPLRVSRSRSTRRPTRARVRAGARRPSQYRRR
jgi:hypothetical protein